MKDCMFCQKTIAELVKTEKRLFKTNATISRKRYKNDKAISSHSTLIQIEKLYMQTIAKALHLLLVENQAWLEKTFHRQRVINTAYTNRKAFSNHPHKATWRVLNHAISPALRTTRLLSLGEGTIVGLFGTTTAIADIPLFIALILRTINLIALNYGFDYRFKNEKFYILRLISFTIIKDSQQKNTYSKIVDALANYIDTDQTFHLNFNKVMQTTAQHLAEALIHYKIAQSIPLLGAPIGGFSNYYFMTQICRKSKLKYQKRYLLNTLNNQSPSL